MIDSVVCWLWPPDPGYRSTFGPEQVNILRDMVARNYPHPHRFLCVTDQVDGLAEGIEVVKPWNDFTHLKNLSGKNGPSCFRRLRAFDPQIGAVFGNRFAVLDLDVVVTGSLDPLFAREEDFVIWGDTNPRTLYNGSLYVLTAGARPQVWNDFDPETSPQAAAASGNFGSDQAWISYKLGPGEARFTASDGVYSYRNEVAQRRDLPSDARLVVFHGHVDPWCRMAQQIPWVPEHYRRGC